MTNRAMYTRDFPIKRGGIILWVQICWSGGEERGERFLMRRIDWFCAVSFKATPHNTKCTDCLKINRNVSPWYERFIFKIIWRICIKFVSERMTKPKVLENNILNVSFKVNISSCHPSKIWTHPECRLPPLEIQPVPVAQHFFLVYD
jgi:hypothetical protein